MHIRRLTRKRPAAAVNFEEIIFIGNGLLGLALSLVSLASSARMLMKSSTGE